MGQENKKTETLFAKQTHYNLYVDKSKMTYHKFDNEHVCPDFKPGLEATSNFKLKNVSLCNKSEVGLKSEKTKS